MGMRKWQVEKNDHGSDGMMWGGGLKTRGRNACLDDVKANTLK